MKLRLALSGQVGNKRRGCLIEKIRYIKLYYCLTVLHAEGGIGVHKSAIRALFFGQMPRQNARQISMGA